MFENPGVSIISKLPLYFNTDITQTNKKPRTVSMPFKRKAQARRQVCCAEYQLYKQWTHKTTR